MWTERFGDRGRAAAVILVLLGIVERMAWNLLRPQTGAEGEAKNVALAIADGRGFADAYHLGQGPTAHLLPVSPGLAGAVYYVLGVRSGMAEFVLSCWSIGLAIGTYVLLYRAFGSLGVPRRLRLVGLAIGCLAPTYISQEAVDFRVWEGGLATFLTALFLERLLTLRSVPAAWRGGGYAQPALVGICASLLFFVNPLLGIAALACLAFFALRHLSPRHVRAALAGVVGITLLTVAPWTIRNATALDAPVPLRSNAGLELALTNYPAAAHTPDERQEFMRRLNEIHPTMNAAAFREMQRVGEVRYFNAMGRVALDWIAAHPGDAARLWLHHIREMIFPSAWKFDVDGNSRWGWLKALLAQAVGLLGIVGLAAIFWRRPRSGALYPAAIIVFTALAVSPFQPVVRYTYLIYPVMVFFAASVPLLFERRQPQASIANFLRI